MTEENQTADSEPASYDEWLDAIAAGEGFYLESPAGVGSLPPRRVCPETGSTDLTRQPLPETGRIETYSVVHVATPGFAADAPYVSAIADFGPVRITGIVRGIDPDAIGDDEDIIGDEVQLTVEPRETTDDRLVVFSPIE
ncbi:nucleic acid-binding protein [Halonotius terrestris]|uniref:Nucleic acid-binding protein n=1 Tax=Halonotius terrestris TaxID=2487750 RepID=A0A8J8PCZ6_9EURY|nr:OB-fold domain-containing protein [Halonotius terrestris]TQQ82927.1 nucleic acid-binding protein [Halonotius terrestris]